MDYQAFRENFIRIFEKNGLQEWISDDIIDKFYTLCYYNDIATLYRYSVWRRK